MNIKNNLWLALCVLLLAASLFTAVWFYTSGSEATPRIALHLSAAVTVGVAMGLLVVLVCRAVTSAFRRVTDDSPFLWLMLGKARLLSNLAIALPVFAAASQHAWADVLQIHEGQEWEAAFAVDQERHERLYSEYGEHFAVVEAEMQSRGVDVASWYAEAPEPAPWNHEDIWNGHQFDWTVDRRRSEMEAAAVLEALDSRITEVTPRADWEFTDLISANLDD